MPHQIIEYSTNVAQQLDIDALLDALHAHASTIEALPLAGLRTRAHPTAAYRIADEHADNAFIAVYLRIGAGRDESLRVEIGQALFATLCKFVESCNANPTIALSYEVQEIDPTTRWNKNHLRDHLLARQQQASKEQ